MTMTPDPTLDQLDRLAGTWTTEATHPAMPGVVHATAISGDMGHDRVGNAEGSVPADAGRPRLHMHYFDSRGVFRLLEASIHDASRRLWRDASGFSPRFTGRFSDRGDTIAGQRELCRDDVHWVDDLRITYTRRT
jgi:hypothetical protein